VTSLTIIPVHLLAKRLYGRRIAFIASGLYVVTPNLVLYGATSMDGVYTLPLLCALYAFFRAVESESRPASTVWSVATGLLLAVSMLMTFSTVCVGFLLGLYGAIAFFRLRPWRRIWAVLLIIGVAFALAYLALYRATGYDLIACLKASMASDEEKMGLRGRSLLPYLDVSFANLLAFTVGCGIVTSLLWAKQVKATVINLVRRQAMDPLLLCFAAAVVLLAFSTLYRFETERIWMFFAPLAIMAAAKQIAHAPGPGGTQRLFNFCLGALFLQTYLMQLFLFTLW
jgi:4-amino-4-deoxy-L-arabinose transferase-like glycosyltransferase